VEAVYEIPLEVTVKPWQSVLHDGGRKDDPYHLLLIVASIPPYAGRQDRALLSFDLLRAMELYRPRDT